MNITPFITVITSVASAMLVFMLQSVIRERNRLLKEKEEKHENEQAAMCKGIRGLLKKELKEIYEKYKDSSTIPSDDYETWVDLFESYEGVHGNGTFKKLDKEIRAKHVV